ncbi:hypothetical protein LX36DRAFT_259025 [Colletotrichum falcatum]|nr:hypothetical protein LX36DRAFT_259025 [Colletotrichum falcatum]
MGCVFLVTSRAFRVPVFFFFLSLFFSSSAVGLLSLSVLLFLLFPKLVPSGGEKTEEWRNRVPGGWERKPECDVTFGRTYVVLDGWTDGRMEGRCELSRVAVSWWLMDQLMNKPGGEWMNHSIWCFWRYSRTRRAVRKGFVGSCPFRPFSCLLPPWSLSFLLSFSLSFFPAGTNGLDRGGNRGRRVPSPSPSPSSPPHLRLHLPLPLPLPFLPFLPALLRSLLLFLCLFSALLTRCDAPETSHERTGAHSDGPLANGITCGGPTCPASSPNRQRLSPTIAPPSVKVRLVPKVRCAAHRDYPMT